MDDFNFTPKHFIHLSNQKLSFAVKRKTKLIFKIIFSLLILSSINKAFAAIKKIDGYYITTTDDTVRCSFLVPYDAHFEFPKYLTLQQKIVAVDAQGKKTKLIPFTTRKCVMKMDSALMTFISIKNPLVKSNGKSGFIFLKQIVKDYLSVFEYYGKLTAETKYYYPNGNHTMGGFYGGYGSATVTYGESLNYFFQKENGVLSLIPYYSFNHDLAIYFADYPTLAKKIQTDEYRKKDILKIAADYNKFITDKEDN